MKRWICVVLAVLMLLPVFSVTAFAHGHGYGNGHRDGSHAQVINQKCADDKVCKTNGTCTNNCQYADENGDNICDNCRNQCVDCGQTTDENGDGICDSCGKCSHYADENNDGICDHQAECANRKKAACSVTVKRSSHHGNKNRKHH